MLYVIVNQASRSGHGRSTWARVEEELKREGIAYRAYQTRRAGHAQELARMISNKDLEDIPILVLGGDGTLNEIFNGLDHWEKVRLGVIPTGSGNDFCGGLKVSREPMDNLRQILQNVESGPEYYRRTDLGSVYAKGMEQERYFGISAGIGMDAIVCYNVDHKRGLKKIMNSLGLGRLSYVLMTLYTLFSMKVFDMELEGVEEEGGKSRTKKKLSLQKVIFSAFMNMPVEGGGVPMAPKASPFDGRLSVSMAFGIPRAITFFCLPLLVAGKQEKLRGFRMLEYTALHVNTSLPVMLHTDGEALGEFCEFTFRLHKGKLHLLN